MKRYHDRVGNLEEVLEACPPATLVTTWFTGERFSGDVELPLERCLWLNNGEPFEAVDRTLVAVTPPLFDAPTTRGLYDTRTGVYWAADCFSTPVRHGLMSRLHRQALPPEVLVQLGGIVGRRRTPPDRSAVPLPALA